MFGAHSTAEEVTEGVDLTGQSWLITGVNSGLGYETARVLALRGAHIVGAARTEAKAQAAFECLGIEGLAVGCDLSDLDHVRGAVATVVGAGGTLDGIVANAGIMALPELQQKDGTELQFLTNHVGHFALVTGLLDRLTKSGRVVMLSSGAHFMAKRGLELDNLSGAQDYDPWRMYGRSKLANILFAKSLARTFEGSQRRANALHPGVIQTNLARHIDDAESMSAKMQNMKTVEQGAATQCFVAVHPQAKNRNGGYFSVCTVAKTLPAARDPELADALWAATEALITAR